MNGVTASHVARWVDVPRPLLVSEPADAVVRLGRDVDMQGVDASGYPGVIYRWQREGVAVADGASGASPDGGIVTGARTSHLHIANACLSDSGMYVLTVANACGEDVSRMTRVIVHCATDVSDASGSGLPDGGVTVDDLLHYLGMYTEGVEEVDMDDGSGNGVADGGASIDDLLYFLDHFAQGC